jgi:hypothetical protein
MEDVDVLGPAGKDGGMSKGCSDGELGRPGVERKTLVGLGLYQCLMADLVLNGGGIQTQSSD